jgi:hypothetical protein
MYIREADIDTDSGDGSRSKFDGKDAPGLADMHIPITRKKVVVSSPPCVIEKVAFKDNLVIWQDCVPADC